jgi:hypothetical protein
VPPPLGLQLLLVIMYTLLLLIIKRGENPHAPEHFEVEIIVISAVWILSNVFGLSAMFRKNTIMMKVRR